MREGSWGHSNFGTTRERIISEAIDFNPVLFKKHHDEYNRLVLQAQFKYNTLEITFDGRLSVNVRTPSLYKIKKMGISFLFAQLFRNHACLQNDKNSKQGWKK